MPKKITGKCTQCKASPTQLYKLRGLYVCERCLCADEPGTTPTIDMFAERRATFDLSKCDRVTKEDWAEFKQYAKKCFEKEKTKSYRDQIDDEWRLAQAKRAAKDRNA